MEKLQTPPELTARPQLTTRPGPAASRAGFVLAALSAAALPVALVMVRGVSRRRGAMPRSPSI